MNFKYKVDVLEFSEVHSIPGAWTRDNLEALMELLDYADVDTIPDEEMMEMTTMALSDLKTKEAIEVVLNARFGDKLTSGQRQNIASEFEDDKLWEEYADIEHHKELFNCAYILNKAFPLAFPVPDILKVKLRLGTDNPNGQNALKDPSKAFITRILGRGMNDHNTIFRLFEDEMDGERFEEAEDIIWEMSFTAANPPAKSIEVTLYTSWNWIDELDGVEAFISTAHPDN